MPNVLALTHRSFCGVSDPQYKYFIEGLPEIIAHAFINTPPSGWLNREAVKVMDIPNASQHVGAGLCDIDITVFIYDFPKREVGTPDVCLEIAQKCVKMLLPGTKISVSILCVPGSQVEFTAS
jgi:hypothetical protein